MTRRLQVAAALAAILWAPAALALSASSPPAKFSIPWGNSASPPYINTIPVPSQIGISNCRASLTDGFPPLTFTPSAAGGCAPFGADFNGIFKQITQWSQWQGAGGTVAYDAAFSASVNGYPKGAILANATAPYCIWVSTADNNTANPDTGGANWSLSCPGGGVGGTSTGSPNAQTIPTTPFAFHEVGSGLCWVVGAGLTNTGSTQIAIAGFGTVSLLQGTPGAYAALVGGELQAGQLACAKTDGTNWVLQESAQYASLSRPDQLLVGGANVQSHSIGTLASTTYTVDCGQSPLQYLTNNGAITLAAPGNDGSCLVMVTNAGSAGAISFSGFTTNSNTGEALTTTSGNKFAITVWRINGVSSYIVKALQ